MHECELVQPYTVQSWICNSVCEHIVETGLYNIGDGNDLFLYWRDLARSYDGVEWDCNTCEILFWLHVVYKLTDNYHYTGLSRDVREVIVKRGFEYKYK